MDKQPQPQEEAPQTLDLSRLDPELKSQVLEFAKMKFPEQPTFAQQTLTQRRGESSKLPSNPYIEAKNTLKQKIDEIGLPFDKVIEQIRQEAIVSAKEKRIEAFSRLSNMYDQITWSQATFDYKARQTNPSYVSRNIPKDSVQSEYFRELESVMQLEAEVNKLELGQHH